MFWLTKCRKKLADIYDHDRDYPRLSNEVRIELMKVIIKEFITDSVENSFFKIDLSEEEFLEYVLDFEDYDILEEDDLKKLSSFYVSLMQSYMHTEVGHINNLVGNSLVLSDWLNFIINNETSTLVLDLQDKYLTEDLLDIEGTNVNVTGWMKVNTEIWSVGFRVFAYYLDSIFEKCLNLIYATGYQNVYPENLMELGFYLEIVWEYFEGLSSELSQAASTVQELLYQSMVDSEAYAYIFDERMNAIM